MIRSSKLCSAMGFSDKYTFVQHSNGYIVGETLTNPDANAVCSGKMLRACPGGDIDHAFGQGMQVKTPKLNLTTDGIHGCGWSCLQFYMHGSISQGPSNSPIQHDRRL